MLEFLDGTDLHNTLRLLLSGGTKRIIVVEGEDDYDLLFEAFAACDVVLMPGYGKPKTLQAAIEAAETGTDPVRFLLDADFDRITGADAMYPSNVVATAHYDLAMDTVAHLPAIVTRIARLASGQVGPEVLNVDAQVDLAFTIAERFGAVRLASYMEAWNLSFDGFPFYMFVADDALGEVDLPAVMTMLVARTGKCELAPDELCATIPTHCGQVESTRVLVNGHDLFDILLHVGRKFGGAKSNTGYETQFKLAAGGEVADVPVVKTLVDWAAAA